MSVASCRCRSSSVDGVRRSVQLRLYFLCRPVVTISSNSCVTSVTKCHEPPPVGQTRELFGVFKIRIGKQNYLPIVDKTVELSRDLGRDPMPLENIEGNQDNDAP